MIPPPNVYPHSGLTLIKVRFQSFCFSSIILIGVPATPESDFFVQNTAIFTGGDEAAFNARFPAPTTLVVGLNTAISPRIY